MEPFTKHCRKRSAILAYLQQSKEHPSAETIYTDLKAEIPDLSVGTVYRNLSLFKKQGLAASIATVNGVERFDGRTEPHVHFICSCCNGVSDLTTLQVPISLKEAAAEACGGKVDGYQLSFTGVCRECETGQRKDGESA